MFSKIVSIALLLPAIITAAPMPSGSWPSSKGSVTNKGAIVVKKGTTFDGGMKTYQRSDIKCNGQSEGGSADSMFILEEGATLKNVIIGINQSEGVHCDKHSCTLENVWWEDVCEDALTVGGGSSSSITRVIGGGARSASDKVVQHNGAGTVSIDGFYVQDFGKLYRSCGNCKANGSSRHVQVSNVYAVNPKATIVGINTNYGDTATIKNLKIKSSKSSVKVCTKFTGNNTGKEPSEIGEGPDGKNCIYSTSDVTITKNRLLREALFGETEE